jgi:F0F1-type ATP synthase membrane subunit b/b'
MTVALIIALAAVTLWALSMHLKLNSALDAHDEREQKIHDQDQQIQSLMAQVVALQVENRKRFARLSREHARREATQEANTNGNP